MSKYQNVTWKTTSNINDYNKIQNKWDMFIIENESPLFFHSSFIKNKMMEMNNNSFTPLLITLHTKNDIIAILPFKIKNTLFTKRIEFIYSEDYNPDIFIKKKYVNKIEQIISQYLKTRFKKYILCLTFSKNSNSLRIIKNLNKDPHTKILLSKLPGHRILKKTGSWDDYVQDRGGSYRRQFKRIIKKLENNGTYEIRIEEDYSRSLMIRNIVEQRSWKSEWRRKRGLDIVHDDNFILLAIKLIPMDYGYRLYFLRFNKVIISYVIVFYQSSVAYICKTTYNENYKSYYPGLLLMNEAIQDMYEDPNIILFDFLTNMSFMSLWTKNVMPHYRVNIIPVQIHRYLKIYSYIMQLIKNTKILPYYKDKISPLIIRSRQNLHKLKKYIR